MPAVKDYLPSRDAQLVTFANHMSSLIAATPTAFGVTATIATALSAAAGTYATKYAVATAPNTRTPSAINEKEQAKTALVAQIRLVARMVQAAPAVTDAQKIDLGLTVRKTPAPRPVPSTSPTIKIVSVTGKTVKLRFEDADATNKRGKPKDVVGLTLFSCVSATQPTEMSQFKFEGNTTLTTIDVGFPPSVAAGATVWFTAFWRNARDESGPAAQPISTTLAGGLSQAA